MEPDRDPEPLLSVSYPSIRLVLLFGFVAVIIIAVARFPPDDERHRAILAKYDAIRLAFDVSDGHVVALRELAVALGHAMKGCDDPVSVYEESVGVMAQFAGLQVEGAPQP